eukprot:4338488-Prymnesium_polylepis.1
MAHTVSLQLAVPSRTQHAGHGPQLVSGVQVEGGAPPPGPAHAEPRISCTTCLDPKEHWVAH